jgi:hypothetical protein
VIANSLYKWLARTFVSDVAKNMEREGTFDLNADEQLKGEDLPHVLVEDRGSDVTIFSFAGMAVLFAGLPVFEFRKLLKQNGADYNLVFFRDIRRSAYVMKPDGTAGGPDFFRQEVERIKAELGSKYNVSIGASAGGAMAFHMARICDFDQIITFSPVLCRDVYTPWRRQLRHYFDIPKLIREPQAYMEVVLMTLGALAITRKVDKNIKNHPWRNVINDYRETEAEKRPRATIYYGETNSPDGLTASMFSDIPEVKTVPVPTGRHNCAAVLKARGEMGDAIMNEIREGLERRATPQSPLLAQRQATL